MTGSPPDPSRPGPNAPSGAPRPPDPAARPGIGIGRLITRDGIRATLRARVPEHGVLAGGGGLVSSSWRVVVDFDTGFLEAARGEPGLDVAGELPESHRSPLSEDIVMALSWNCRELLTGDSAPQPVATPDSMGLLLVAAGSVVWELAPPGPITAGHPADLHAYLQALAWPSS